MPTNATRSMSDEILMAGLDAAFPPSAPQAAPTDFPECSEEIMTWRDTYRPTHTDVVVIDDPQDERPIDPQYPSVGVERWAKVFALPPGRTAVPDDVQ